MKKQSMLFAGLLLSTGIVLAQEEGRADKFKPTEPKNFNQVYKYQHRLHLAQPDSLNSRNSANLVNKQNPKPPRLVSPNEYQRLQAKMAADFDGKPVVNSKDAATNRSHFLSLKNTRLNKSTSASALIDEGCTHPDDLVGLSGDDLVISLKGGSLSACLYGLYDNQLAGSALFSDANLLTVTQAISALLVTYDGSNETGAVALEKLITYLRAMHWAEGSTGRVFQANYQALLTQVFDVYFSGDHFLAFNGDSSRDFMIRFEMLILLNSSKVDRQAYLARFSEALIGYANSVSRSDDWGVYYQEQGFTNLLVHFFNASSYQDDAFKTTLINHPEIIDNLIQFVSADGLWLIGHTREYQWADSITELGRLLKFSGEIADKVRPTMVTILSTYAYQALGSSGWVNAQSMVKFYDSANCSMYGEACSFDLEGVVLSGNYACSDTVKLRYQGEISSENLTTTCSILNAGQAKFHQVFGSNANSPVADDFNEALEVVVFSASSDYENFAGDFFGINTDNGGMYLEGTPSSESSQARFIAFQATWLPGFSIWNLEHEQYHYLDGRFNKWGDFNDQAENSVWWAEGLAEYLAQPANNAQALAVAPQHTYQLSELFQTTYANSNQTRTYSWGYLATRFMMENHRAEIDTELLPSMRAAKYLPPDDGDVSNEGCIFDWGWQAKPDAEENNWLWLYDDSENGYSGSGYWVWTCGQPDTGEVPEDPDEEPLPEFTPYQDILNNWGSNFDSEFDQWLDCIVAGEGYCQGTEQRLGDLDNNLQIDERDITQFTALLRRSDELGLEYDFNDDASVNRKDIRALMMLCDLARCAVATANAIETPVMTAAGQWQPRHNDFN